MRWFHTGYVCGTALLRAALFVSIGAWFAVNGRAAEVKKSDAATPKPNTTEEYWALKPIVRPAPPTASNKKTKPRNPIDHFIYARLAETKMTPSAEASRRILIRRLYFDLIGLPPTPEEVRAFENDKSRDAYEKVVERLLSSPQYGERWAQHWLDAVRFAESHGFEMNQPRPNAWRYRDYVIESLNRDKPYDRFVTEQFAGDVLGEDAATGFLVAGPWDQVKSPDPVLTAAQRADELHDMVSTTGSAFLGLTVGCARCHNHKFDPIPQTDYYAIKASLAGVEHGERKLRTPDLEERQKELKLSQDKLASTENTLVQFEPIARTGRFLTFDPEPKFGSKVSWLIKKAARFSYPDGTGRGEKDDPGDLERIPNATRSYLAFSNAVNTDVFAYEPGVDGRFQVWLSWGCGSTAYGKDARFILDRDGNLETTDDQTEIAKVNEQHFFDGTGEAADNKLWSGYYDAGSWELSSSNKIVLRGGPQSEVVTVSAMALTESEAEPSVASHRTGSGGGDVASEGETTAAAPRQGNLLRGQVSPRRNSEHFATTRARRLRFTVLKTTDAEPCIDELEVYTAEAKPKNIALASAGTKGTASSVFPNSDIHKLEHLNDGKYGNSRSWISNERSKGWVELEFPEEVVINRVVWGRDREQQFSDRLATDYRIEVALSTNDWRLVASSKDRVPYSGGRTSSPDFTVIGLSAGDAQTVKGLLKQRTKLESRIKELNTFPMAYAGSLKEKPEPVYRLQRGDAMQKREVIEPGVLSAVTVGLTKSPAKQEVTEDQQRRLRLASWLTNPANPLPARVMVNRLWQHHFGEGLVNTPSDFGRNGSKPSHPELLDWLASEFITPKCPAWTGEPAAVPWSIKHIHRLIVTSASYRQASTARADCLKQDAGSRLIWRFPPQRLEAEPLRDAILALSGKLDLRAGGPGFSCFETNDNYVRQYQPKKEFGTNEWRRMVYMTKVRMQQDSTFGAFDCPDGGQIAPKRMRSTTPLQALNLLNSTFLIQQADFFAERLEKEAGKNSQAEIVRAFELVFNRKPESSELKMAEELVTKHGLPMFCRALFNSNEFIFVE